MQDQIEERDVAEGIGAFYGLRDSHSAKELLEALEQAVASADQCEILDLVLIAMAEMGKLENSPPVCHLVERAKSAWLQRLGMVSSFSGNGESRFAGGREYWNDEFTQTEKEKAMDLQQALVALGWWWNKLGHLMTDAEIITRAIWANRDL